MATPDLTSYVDLRFFDKDPQDVFDAALVDLQTKIPDWIPREGNIEVLLLEALGIQVAEAIFAVNRLPGAVVMALLRLYGIDPDSGAQPTVDLEFELSDTAGHDVPAGTAVRLDLDGGLEPVVFTTTVALAVPPSSATGTVLAVGNRFTAEANGVASGTNVELIDSVVYVDRVDTASVVADGADPETDERWVERGVQRFARLSETLVLPRNFESAALEDPAVMRAKALDNWDGAGGAPGDDPGHVTIAVYGDGDVLSAPARDAIDAEMEAQAAANLSVHVVDPTITAVDVTVQVRRDPGYDETTVIANVEAALTVFLNTDTWDWDTKVRRNDLISLITNVVGVDYVDTLTTPAADVTLAGAANLVSAGTLTVTTII